MSRFAGRPRKQVRGPGFFAQGLVATMMLIGLILALSLPAAAQTRTQSGPGRGAGEFYAPYRGNPEDEVAKANRNQPADSGDSGRSREPAEAPGNEGPAPGPEAPSPPESWPSPPPVVDPPPPANVGPPTGRAVERREMMFPDTSYSEGHQEDPNYEDTEEYREYRDYQTPTSVPLPPVAQPPKAASPSPDQPGPEPGRPVTEGPAGAAPALLSIHSDETRAALPKGAVPGLITNPGDVSRLKKMLKNNDPDGRLGWEAGAELSGAGLKADGEGRLSGLTLENMGLSGVLDLSGAAGLLEFKSVGNPLTGLKMAGLSQLGSLTLTGGSLTRLERGSLAGLSELSTLDLRRNRLEKIDPNALADLKSLETLYLNDNRLEQLPKGCFTGLSALSELNLNHNHLSEVKWGALAPLVGLETLQLAHNRLTEIHSGFFPGLVNLEILHLENNRLTNLTREALAGLPSLKYVDLSNNYLRSMPPLNQLENLAEVDLIGNCLSLGAIRQILETVPDDVNFTLHLRDQKNVYFGLRVQLLPGQNSYLIPPEDAFIDDVPSQGRILGPDPAGAVYSPAEALGQPGRLTFQRPGVYALRLTNSGLGDDAAISATTGTFLIVDSYPEADEADKRLGRRDLAGDLVRTLASQGFVEAPAAHPKRISALKALFSPDSELDSGDVSRPAE